MSTSQIGPSSNRHYWHLNLFRKVKFYWFHWHEKEIIPVGKHTGGGWSELLWITTQRPMSHYKTCSRGSMMCWCDPKANVLGTSIRLRTCLRYLLLREREGSVKGDCSQGTEKPSWEHEPTSSAENRKSKGWGRGIKSKASKITGCMNGTHSSKCDSWNICP